MENIFEKNIFSIMLEKILRKKTLSEYEVNIICSKVVEILICEPNIPYVFSPIAIIGDIHGQFDDLVKLIEIKGIPDKFKYIFLGDYVDRGDNSMGCIMLLFIYKILYPDRIYLIRGNHEQRQINRIYGFYDEIVHIYGMEHLWNTINDVFAFLNIGCIVDRKYLCLHGGISNRISISNLQKIDRFQPIKEGDLFNDVLWSDPGDTAECVPNQRGCGVMFGLDTAKQFIMENNIDLIIRSHQCVQKGYQFDLESLVLTVWSAPNYMNRGINPGTVLVLEPDLPITVDSFRFYRRPL